MGLACLSAIAARVVMLDPICILVDNVLLPQHSNLGHPIRLDAWAPVACLHLRCSVSVDADTSEPVAAFHPLTRPTRLHAIDTVQHRCDIRHGSTQPRA